jgi:TRAP-type C4-dicarboxylate transport system substrate-binding protein
MVRIGRMGAALTAGLVGVPLAACAGPGVNKAGGQAARPPVVLTLANPLGSSEEVDGFAGEVARLSGGTIRIDVRSRWRYGQVAFESGLIGDVGAGKADLGIVGSRAWDSVGVTSLRALGAPLLIDSYALQERVVTSPPVAQMLEGLAPLGLVGLGVLPGPLRYPFGIARPLRGPSDYAGLRIGVEQSGVGSATVRALGGTPVDQASRPGSAPPPIAGLDGMEGGISLLEGISLAGGYLTGNVVLWPRPLVVFASRETLAKLTPAQRRILAQAVASDVIPETNVLRDDQRTAISDMCRSHQLQFVEAGSADMVALRRAVQPVYAQLERNPGSRMQIAAIQAMRAGIAPEPAPSCGPAARPTAKTGILDGDYQFTSTPADLRAAGGQPNEAVPENYGAWTIVVDGGRFALAQQNAQACTWAYGTITVEAGTLQLLVTNGGGLAPTGALDKPDELWTYRWSLYRDALTLRGVPGAVSPAPTMARAWRRVSVTPSARFLGNRCPPPVNALGG